jgi:MinD-like ATPase involved in chromosome partitioning or flagellar assembly
VALFALTAAKGSPGVSTCALALALVWPLALPGRRVLLVDADVAGGGSVSAFQRHGLGEGRGLLGWTAASPSDDRLERQLLALDGEDRWLLSGLPDAGSAAALAGRWAELRVDLENLQRERGIDVLVDLGRCGARHEATPLLAGADAVLVVLRSTFESVSLTSGIRGTLPTGAGGTARVVAMLVGDRDPYSAREVGTDLQLPVVATLSRDPRGAQALSAGAYERALRSRSALLRSAQIAAVAVAALAPERSRA